VAHNFCALAYSSVQLIITWWSPTKHCSQCN